MIEQFHGTPAESVRAAFGTTFTFVDGTGGMGLVPVVGVDIKVGNCTNRATISDPALVRKLIEDLEQALRALEASRG